MRVTGLEPAQRLPLAPKASASANSATPANKHIKLKNKINKTSKKPAAACVTLAVPKIFNGLGRLKILTAAPFFLRCFFRRKRSVKKLPIPPHPQISILN